MTNILLLPLSIAPMIDWTYCHFRVFMRILAPQALLYTEMQTTGAIQHNPHRALYYANREHPIALQLGGSDKYALAEAAKRAEQAGYDEVNINLGCPSNKVQAGRFGACLMKEPKLVADCIHAIKQAVSIPVSAKTRIGIDDQDSYAFFSAFAHEIKQAGCDKLIVHARKAWLSGLNPKQNRTIPPVNYDFVYQIKSELLHLPVIINGNILNVREINYHLLKVDGVMIGRLACDNPYHIAEIHHELYPHINLIKRSEAFNLYHEYLLDEFKKGTPLSLLIKPIFGLAFGLPGASQWKRILMSIMSTQDLTQFNALIQFLFELEEKTTTECI